MLFFRVENKFTQLQIHFVITCSTSELKQTKGIRLFNKNKALWWSVRGGWWHNVISAQCSECQGGEIPSKHGLTAGVTMTLLR